jgi:hypothetical protein
MSDTESDSVGSEDENQEPIEVKGTPDQKLSLTIHDIPFNPYSTYSKAELITLFISNGLKPGHLSRKELSVKLWDHKVKVDGKFLESDANPFGRCHRLTLKDLLKSHDYASHGDLETMGKRIWAILNREQARRSRDESTDAQKKTKTNTGEPSSEVMERVDHIKNVMEDVLSETLACSNQIVKFSEQLERQSKVTDEIHELLVNVFGSKTKK